VDKIAVGKNFLFIEIKTNAQIDDIFVNLQEGLSRAFSLPEKISSSSDHKCFLGFLLPFINGLF
jgi:hypothetical protein